LKRLEDARLTNSAAAMRDATDDLQAALLDIKTQLLPCSQLQVATANTMPGHIMPPGIDSATPVSPVSSGGGADPHAAHVIQAAPSGGATAVPEAAKGAVRARPLTPAATAEAAPVSAGPPTNIADLKCRTETDQKTAPRMLYQGRMYYFCSEQERAEFAKNPGRYVTSAPEAAPAHAH
jgi:YHS domain-containing protein